MFEDEPGPEEGIPSQWRDLVPPLFDAETQASSGSKLKSHGTQTAQVQNAYAQTTVEDVMQTISSSVTQEDQTNLAESLQRALPSMEQELQHAATTTAFKDWEAEMVSGDSIGGKRQYLTSLFLPQQSDASTSASHQLQGTPSKSTMDQNANALQHVAEPVLSVALSASGDTLAASIGSCDEEDVTEHHSTVAVWNLSRARLKQQISKPDWKYEFLTGAAATCLGWSRQNPSLLAVGLTTGAVALLDTATADDADDSAKCLWTGSMASLASHAGAVNGVCFVYDVVDSREIIVTTANDGFTKFWHVKQKDVQNVFPASSCKISANMSGRDSSKRTDFSGMHSLSALATSSADSNFLALGTNGGEVLPCILSWPDVRESSNPGAASVSSRAVRIGRLSVPFDGPVTGIDTNPFMAEALACCSADGQLLLVRGSTGEIVCKLQPCAEGMLGVQWSANNATRLFAGTADGRILEYDTAMSTAKPAHIWAIKDIGMPSSGMQQNSTKSSAFSHSADRVAMGALDGRIHIWNIPASQGSGDRASQHSLLKQLFEPPSMEEDDDDLGITEDSAMEQPSTFNSRSDQPVSSASGRSDEYLTGSSKPPSQHSQPALNGASGLPSAQTSSAAAAQQQAEESDDSLDGDDPW